MEFAFARMSTKGQIVIPSFMRGDINPGDQMLLVKDKKRIIMKSVESMAKDLRADARIAADIERVWRKHEKGQLKSMSKEEFLKELRKW